MTSRRVWGRFFTIRYHPFTTKVKLDAKKYLKY